MDNERQPIQMKLSKKKNYFLTFFLRFWNVEKSLKILKEKITFMADVFPKLQTWKDVVRQIFKMSRSSRTFEKEHGKRAQALLKSPRQHLIISLWIQLSWKKSLLVICKILGLFVNTMTADDKHSLLNRDNLRQSIQMQLCQKQTTFS